MKRLAPTVLWIAAASALAAPVTSEKPLPEQIERSQSDFDADIRFNGPDVLWKTHSSDKLWTKLLVLKNAKTGRLTWAIVLQAEYSYQWRFYESVSLVGGKTIQAVNLGRHVAGCSHGSCTYLEGAAVYLEEPEVSQALGSGIRLRWNGRNYGSFPMELPAFYFKTMREVAESDR